MRSSSRRLVLVQLAQVFPDVVSQLASELLVHDVGRGDRVAGREEEEDPRQYDDLPLRAIRPTAQQEECVRIVCLKDVCGIEKGQQERQSLPHPGVKSFRERGKTSRRENERVNQCYCP